MVTFNLLFSYLRLYTTMPVAKMAAFLEMPENDFRTHLLCFKHKMKNVVWTKGTSGLDGELQSGSEVNYFLIAKNHKFNIRILNTGGFLH